MNEEHDLSYCMRAITISREYGSGGGRLLPISPGACHPGCWALPRLARLPGQPGSSAFCSSS